MDTDEADFDAASTSTSATCVVFPGQPYGASCTGETLPSCRAGPNCHDVIAPSELLKEFPDTIPIPMKEGIIPIHKSKLEYQAQGTVRSYWRTPTEKGRPSVGVKIQFGIGVKVYAHLVDEESS